MTPYHRILSLTEQRSLSVGEPATVAIADRVHHDDLDALNHVNNTRYMVWFERGRMRFFAHHDISRLEVSSHPRLVIRSGEIRWLEEMRNGETYVITTRCTAMRNTSMTLEQTIWSEGRKRATFSCVIVLLQPDSNDRAPIPDKARVVLLAEGARQD